MRKKIWTMLVAVMMIVPLAFCLTACGGDDSGNGGKLSVTDWNAKFDALKPENLTSYTMTYDDAENNGQHIYKIDYENEVGYHRFTHTVEGVEVVSEYYAVKKDGKYYACSKQYTSWNVIYKNESEGKEWLHKTGSDYMLEYFLSAGREENYTRFNYDQETKLYTHEWNGERFKFDVNSLSFWYNGEVENPYILTNCNATTIDVPDHIMEKINQVNVQD